MMVAAALAGCQTPGSQLAKQSRDRLASVAVCCSKIADAKIRPLPMKPTDLELGVNSQAFGFDDGKAFFEMFKLPPYTAPYSILIGSKSTGTVQDMAVMAPRISLLDENFKPTRHFDESTLRQRGNVFERTIFINPDNSSERYLVLYGSPVDVSRDSTVNINAVTPIFVGTGMFMWQTGGEAKSSLHYSPTGSYFISQAGL